MLAKPRTITDDTRHMRIELQRVDTILFIHGVPADMVGLFTSMSGIVP